ncbi:MAG TPA: hypothetical protein VL326_30530 [Kofleriaceae bacterium]|jgi:hypothetical protein|nr:hypothetical protein [Kofleriaceae bacterium]
MRLIVALLVILVGSATASADRAMTIAQGLQVTPEQAATVAATLARYDADLYKLRYERAELRRQMLSEHTDRTNQQLLDDTLANARALVALDEALITSLRAQVSADAIVHVLMMLNASEPEAPRMLPPQRPGAVTKRSRNGCDPFEQMHRCPNVPKDEEN